MAVAAPLTREVARRYLGRHLRGTGLEIGPGHAPYPLPPGARARYVDRWQPDENHARFPELAASLFPAPDIVANLDRDRLTAIADDSVDFVIASHVIEHLADPIGFLGEISRVLRRGGVALLLVPDRRRTFDSGRSPTSLEHLIDDHRAGVTEVDDDHITEFLTQARAGASFVGIPADPAARGAWFQWHRERSIHVHCWSDDEFADVIQYGVLELGHAWELLDAIATAAQGPQGAEFGYVLRRVAQADPTATADRLGNAWRAWRRTGRPVFSVPPAVVESGAVLELDVPRAGEDVGHEFVVGGWAVDAAADSGIDMIEVWTAVAPGHEVFADVVPTGGHRPDVALAVGEHGRNSGFTVGMTGLAPGVYDVIVCAHSAMTDAFVATVRRRIRVSAS